MSVQQASAPAVPPIGLPVFSVDGVHLGYVRAINSADGWFKVDTQMEPDYWIELGDIKEITSRAVLLQSRRSEVRRRKHEMGAENPPTTFE
jgi:hypothetical protein